MLTSAFVWRPLIMALAAALVTAILASTAFAEGNPAQDQYADEPTQSEPSTATPPSDTPPTTPPSDTPSTTPPSDTPSTPNLKEWHPPTGIPGDEAGQPQNPSQGQNLGGQQNTDEGQPEGPGSSSQEQQQQNPKEGLPDKGTQPANPGGKVIVDVIPQPTGGPPAGDSCERAKTWWVDSSGAVWAQWAGWCWDEKTGWSPWKGATFGPFTTETLPYLAPETSGLSQGEIDALRKYLPGGVDPKELEALRGDLQPNGGADSGGGEKQLNLLSEATGCSLSLLGTAVTLLALEIAVVFAAAIAVYATVSVAAALALLSAEVAILTVLAAVGALIGLTGVLVSIVPNLPAVPTLNDAVVHYIDQAIESVLGTATPLGCWNFVAILMGAVGGVGAMIGLKIRAALQKRGLLK